MQILQDKGKTGEFKAAVQLGRGGSISVEHVDSDPLQLLPDVSEPY